MPWPLDWFKALRGESTAAAQPGPTEQRASHEWDALPPIQTTAGSMETTADSLGFVRQLPGRTGPEPALQPLGHLRSLEAPRGLADLALGAVQTYAGQEGMTLKRRPASVQALRWPGEGDVAQPPSAAEEPRLDETLAQEPVAAPDPTAELPPLAAPRPVVAVPLPAPITANRLTQAPLDLAPPSPPLPASPSPPAVRAGAAAPGPGFTALRTPAAEKDSRINLGQARRLGLGPPLPFPPSVQRSNADREGQSPEGQSNELDRLRDRSEPIGKGAAATTGASDPPPAPVPSGAPPAHPILRIQRREAAGSAASNDAAGPPPIADSPAFSDSPALANPPPAGSDSTVAFGLSPREPGLRFTTAGATRLAAVQPLRESAPGRSDRSGSGQAGGILALTAQRTPAAAQPALVSVQRGADRLRNGSPQAGGTHSPGESHPASAARPDLPLAPFAPSTTADSPFEFETQREHSHLRPAVQRATAAALHRPVAEFFPLAGSSTVQPRFDVPAVQRAGPAAAPGAVPSGDATPAAGSAPGAGGAPGGDAGPPGGGGAAIAAPVPGQSEKELDELARKLYDRIRYHLRSELLIDRERAGVLTDLR